MSLMYKYVDTLCACLSACVFLYAHIHLSRPRAAPNLHHLPHQEWDDWDDHIWLWIIPSFPTFSKHHKVVPQS